MGGGVAGAWATALAYSDLTEISAQGGFARGIYIYIDIYIYIYSFLII